MQYMLLIYGAENAWTEEERRECMVDSLALCDELASQGKFVAASPLHSVTTATTLRVRSGKRHITDGPFAETTEQLGGYYIIDVDNLDEAMAIASRLPPAKKGAVEIRPVFDLSGLKRDDESSTIVSARVLPFPRGEVFEAIAAPDVLARWWGPQGFTNIFDEFDFRTGGDWRFVMHGPDGKRYENHSVFETIVAPELVVLNHMSPPQFKMTMSLSTIGPAETRLVWRMQFDSPAAKAAVESVVVPSNEQNFDRLLAQLAAVRGKAMN